MKPGDHPEFFTRSPPPGRTRESTIVLDEEGRFWHEGRLVEHRGMAEAFASWIDRHPHDGRYILNNGYDWSYFTVKDVPLFVRTLHLPLNSDEPSLRADLSDGRCGVIDPASLHVGSRGAVYCTIDRAAPSGRFDARLSRDAQLSLAPLLREGTAGGPLELQIAGVRYPIAGT